MRKIPLSGGMRRTDRRRVLTFRDPDFLCLCGTEARRSSTRVAVDVPNQKRPDQPTLDMMDFKFDRRDDIHHGPTPASSLEPTLTSRDNSIFSAGPNLLLPNATDTYHWIENRADSRFPSHPSFHLDSTPPTESSLSTYWLRPRRSRPPASS